MGRGAPRYPSGGSGPQIGQIFRCPIYPTFTVKGLTCRGNRKASSAPFKTPDLHTHSENRILHRLAYYFKKILRNKHHSSDIFLSRNKDFGWSTSFKFHSDWFACH